MIVLDECIDDDLIARAISVWYQGKVISIRALRPGTLIKDDAIATLLQRVAQPTFITINVDDFWKQNQADSRYCIITIEIDQDQTSRLSIILRRLLNLSEFHTKATRMGKVARVRPTHIEYYRENRQIQKLLWSE